MICCHIIKKIIKTCYSDYYNYLFKNKIRHYIIFTTYLLKQTHINAYPSQNLHYKTTLCKDQTNQDKQKLTDIKTQLILIIK